MSSTKLSLYRLVALGIWLKILAFNFAGSSATASSVTFGGTVEPTITIQLTSGFSTTDDIPLKQSIPIQLSAEISFFNSSVVTFKLTELDLSTNSESFEITLEPINGFLVTATGEKVFFWVGLATSDYSTVVLGTLKQPKVELVSSPAMKKLDVLIQFNPAEVQKVDSYKANILLTIMDSS